MALTIKIRSDLKPLYRKVKNATERGQYALVSQVLADTNKYVPQKYSDLRNSAYISNNNKQIIWNAPYATYQYYNQYKNYTTPGTGPKWDRKAKGAHIKSWQKVARRAMKLR